MHAEGFLSDSPRIYGHRDPKILIHHDRSMIHEHSLANEPGEGEEPVKLRNSYSIDAILGLKQTVAETTKVDQASVPGEKFETVPLAQKQHSPRLSESSSPASDEGMKVLS